MPEYLAPGVYVEETSFRSKSIEGVGTSTCAYVGLTARGPAGVLPPLLTSFADYERYYGGVDDLRIGGNAMPNYLAHAARLPGVRMARVGTGRNNVTQRLLTRIKKHEGPLGWRVSADGWVRF